MWQQLTPSDKARLLGTALVSLALFALATALSYTAYQVGSVREQLPALLTQVEQTAQKIGPVLSEMNAIRELIPPILKEVQAIRETVPPVLKEVQATREALPSVLAEAKALREALPPLVEQSAAAAKNAGDAVRTIEPHIPVVLTEVRKTREALPGLLDRADQTIARAAKLGQKTSSGAVTGLLGGIITAPFRLIGQFSKGLAGAMGLSGRGDFTAEDERLAGVATNAVIQNGQIGTQQTWRNPASKNAGSASLLKRGTRDDRPCFTLRHRVEFGSGKTHQADIEMCQQTDDSWVGVKP